MLGIRHRRIEVDDSITNQTRKLVVWSIPPVMGTRNWLLNRNQRLLEPILAFEPCLQNHEVTARNAGKLAARRTVLASPQHTGLDLKWASQAWQSHSKRHDTPDVKPFF